MIQFIVFSKDRPLQLEGYIRSLLEQCKEEIAISVLVYYNRPYMAAYDELRERYPYIHFVTETDFYINISGLVDRSAADLICFGCDDVIFINPINVGTIHNFFSDNLELIGLSLRLGLNIHTGMFGNSMTRPALDTSSTPFIQWNVDEVTSKDDWAYPWEVLGTVYPKVFAKQVMESSYWTNPSQLEANGVNFWRSVTNKRLFASYYEARIVVPTVNLVQTEYLGNGIKGATALTPEFLLDCWNAGLRMDIDKFTSQSYDSWRISDFYLKRI